MSCDWLSIITVCRFIEFNFKFSPLQEVWVGRWDPSATNNVDYSRRPLVRSQVTLKVCTLSKLSITKVAGIFSYVQMHVYMSV